MSHLDVIGKFFKGLKSSFEYYSVESVNSKKLFEAYLSKPFNLYYDPFLQLAVNGTIWRYWGKWQQLMRQNQEPYAQYIVIAEFEKIDSQGIFVNSASKQPENDLWWSMMDELQVNYQSRVNKIRRYQIEFESRLRLRVVAHTLLQKSTEIKEWIIERAERHGEKRSTQDLWRQDWQDLIDEFAHEWTGKESVLSESCCDLCTAIDVLAIGKRNRPYFCPDFD